MNVSINPVSAYNKMPVNKVKHYNNSKNITFQGNENKVMRYLSYSAASLAMVAALSCLGSKAQKHANDTDSTNTNTELTDSSNAIENSEDNSIETHYHYTVQDGEITGNDYSWIEKTYPDGKVEKDSMGYKIIETPDGERTVSTVEQNVNGENVIRTTYPDGSKGIRIENGVNYKDTIFWANGNIKQVKNKEVVIEEGQSKSPYDVEELILNQTYKVYDENGTLLYWEVVDNNEKLDENNFKYDKQGRLIDNGYTKFEYKDDSKTPFRITDELEGCKYITEMDEDGFETNKYFKASNGVVTPYSIIYSTSW